MTKKSRIIVILGIVLLECLLSKHQAFNGVPPPPAEIQARDGKMNDGFDPPLSGDKDINNVRDEDDWVPWTRVAKGGRFQVNELTQLVTSSASMAQMLEVVPANDSVNLIEVPTRYPDAAIFPLTIKGKASASTAVNQATLEVRLKNSNPTLVVARMKMWVVPEMPTTDLKYYFVTDSRYSEEVAANGTMLGTKIRDDSGGPGSMSDEADQRFNQIGAHMALAGPTESRDVSFLGPPDYYTSQSDQTGPRWNSDGLEYHNPQQIAQLFPRKDFPGGHIGTILVHRLGGSQGGYYSPESTLCFVAYDKWYSGSVGAPSPYPFWGGSVPGSLLTPDSLGRDATRGRAFSHEIGHALLPVRNRPDLQREPASPPVNGWAGGHDFGPAPETTDALMRASGSAKGKWLRQEDWKTAFEALQRRMGIQ
ncbi:MAG: hypothetical protein WCI46_14900 [Verrucomicrobiota bacterium]